MDPRRSRTRRKWYWTSGVSLPGSTLAKSPAVPALTVSGPKLCPGSPASEASSAAISAGRRDCDRFAGPVIRRLGIRHDNAESVDRAAQEGLTNVQRHAAAHQAWVRLEYPPGQVRLQVIDDLVDFHMPPRSYADAWDVDGLHKALQDKLNLDLPIQAWAAEEGVDQDAIRDRIAEQADRMMADKTEAFGLDTMRSIEKQVLLQAIDGKWREHLLRLEHLRSVVGFRGYAQRDPLSEFKTEAFTLFESMLNSLRQDVTQKLSLIRPLSQAEQEAMMQQLLAQQQPAAKPVLAVAEAPAPAAAAEPAGARLAGFDEKDPTTWGNPSRNDPCPCGSGQKFKHCHGALV